LKSTSDKEILSSETSSYSIIRFSCGFYGSD